MPLDEKGRCCGRWPIVYKRWHGAMPPHRFCCRCDRAYALESGLPIENWAWDADHITSKKKADLVERIARIIAPEAFNDFADWVRIENGETKPFKPSGIVASRMAYERSKAIVKAVAVLGALKHLPTGAIEAALIEHEVEGWRERGIDHPELRAIVEKKHRAAQSAVPPSLLEEREEPKEST